MADLEYHRGELLSYVGKGWHPLIIPLIDFCLDYDPPIKIVQIKEKFGTLRFYTGAAPEELFDMIHKAALKSQETCEKCGKPGKLRGKSWVYTACDEHIHKEDKHGGPNHN